MRRIRSTLLAAAALAACSAPAPEATTTATAATEAASMGYAPAAGSALEGELAAARAATEKYRSLDAAIADGYADIDVVIPTMGEHYMKQDLVDGTFDATKPEILVYWPKPDGTRELVGLEYAVPLAASAEAPAGFTGDADVWDQNHDFGLWLVHAWVWLPNDEGMFHMVNSKVVF